MASAYLTATDLEAYFEPSEIVQISNLHNPTATVLDAVKAAKGIEWASGLADSYLAVRYVLPLPATLSPPDSLKSRIADLWRYGMDTIAPREDVRKRYEDAIKWLEALAKGDVSLGPDFPLNSLAPVPEGIVGGEAGILVPPPIFGGGGLDGF